MGLLFQKPSQFVTGCPRLDNVFIHFTDPQILNPKHLQHHSKSQGRDPRRIEIE